MGGVGGGGVGVGIIASFADVLAILHQIVCSL